LIEYSEVKNVKDTAFNDGKIEGKVEGKIEGIKTVAKALKAQGIAFEIIMASTGLTAKEIEAL
jgi:predicted transposase/invertase (TIGR01784 family)